RFEFGLGRGSSTTAQQGFGIPEPDMTRDMFDEVVGEFRRMWRADEYPGFEGSSFAMPARNVLPKPYTKPHPPMWVAAGSPGTFQKAAQMGLGVVGFTMGGPGPLKPLIELYKKEIERAEPVGEYVNDNIMVTTQLLCLEDGARVRELGGALSMGYQNSLVFRYLDTFPRPDGIPVWPDLIPESTPAEIDARIRERSSTFGSPGEEAGALERYEAGGVDQVVFGLLSSTISRELGVEIIETFGTHVLSQFDRDPEHRTTQQRRAQCG